MPSLRDSVARTPAIRPRALGLQIAPFLGDRAGGTPQRILEEAALTVLATVFARSGPFRELLLSDRRRFERIAGVVLQLPAASRGRDS